MKGTDFTNSPSRRWRHSRRNGLTLAELLVATTIMLMIAGAVASLTATVQSTNDYCRGYTVAGQHARVALSRIERALARAQATEQFPGCLVLSEQAGSQILPDTLVVWSPTATITPDASGLPRTSELVIFCPDPAHPNELLEIRSPDDNSLAPAATNPSAWSSLATNFKTSQTTSKVKLTDRLRTAPITGEYNDSLSPADLRRRHPISPLDGAQRTGVGSAIAGARRVGNLCRGRSIVIERRAEPAPSLVRSNYRSFPAACRQPRPQPSRFTDRRSSPLNYLASTSHHHVLLSPTIPYSSHSSQ